MTFYTDTILKSTWHTTPGVCRDMDMLEPGFRVRVRGMIDDAHLAGHELRVMETFRSQARQAALYAQGRTTPGRVATQLRTVGAHGYGLACDLGLFVDGGKYDGRGDDYMFFVALCAKHRLVSGINWGTAGPHGFKDYDHVQGIPVFRQAALFAGTWYPPPGYDPVTDQVSAGVR